MARERGSRLITKGSQAVISMIVPSTVTVMIYELTDLSFLCAVT
jgi:hypothetical protein